jgi:hypothetical protein
MVHGAQASPPPAASCLPQVVAALDEGGAQIDARDAHSGLTALAAASAAGAAPVVVELLRRGADAYAYADGGATPMTLAARGGHLACLRVRLLGCLVAHIESTGCDTCVQGCVLPCTWRPQHE